LAWERVAVSQKDECHGEGKGLALQVKFTPAKLILSTCRTENIFRRSMVLKNHSIKKIPLKKKENLLMYVS
jgi:hypothetical protein